MTKLLHKEKHDWKGVMHELELYESNNLENISPVKQVQAVVFVDDNNVVLYKHIDGYYGLPGGTVEIGEKFEDALRREILEESSSEVLDFGLIGYVKDTPLENPDKTVYQLRYWVNAKLLDIPINDPDGKAIEREIVELKDVVEKINWGERWEILLNLAVSKRKNKAE